MSAVSLQKLGKTYFDKKGAGVKVVHDIDLEIREGEFMVFVGPSGCGKSTTLRMIAGLEGVSDGLIKIGDRIVNEVSPADRDIAMVFQNYALYPHMTVFENMAFGLKLRKFSKEEIKQRVEEAANLLGLESYLQRKPKALSGGQRQRVAVGRAIVRQPSVFLFDEPLSNLDAKMRVGMRSEISALHRRLASTMIYVTHDQVEAMTMGDRICVMKDGRIMQVADPMTLYQKPANLFVAGFIGSPPMNFLNGRICRSDDGLKFCEEGASGGIEFQLDGRLTAIAEGHLDKPIVFGIRPENISEFSDTSAARESLVKVEATAERSELMGAETMCFLRTEAHGFIYRMPSLQRVEPGQTLSLTFDLEQSHLFDAASELVLG